MLSAEHFVRCGLNVKLCGGSCLYAINAYDRHNAAYTTGVKNMRHNFPHFVCYRNNVVCLKCMPYEQNAVRNGTNLLNHEIESFNVRMHNQMSLIFTPADFRSPYFWSTFLLQQVLI